MESSYSEKEASQRTENSEVLLKKIHLICKSMGKFKPKIILENNGISAISNEEEANNSVRAIS